MDKNKNINTTTSTKTTFIMMNQFFSTFTNDKTLNHHYYVL